MRLIRTAVAIVVGSTIALGSGQALAGPHDVIIAEANDGEETVTEPDPGLPYIVGCTYRDLVYSGNRRYENGDYLMLYIDASWYRFHPDSGAAWVRSFESCDWSDGGITSGSMWRPLSDPDPEIAIDPAYEKVEKIIKTPTPDLSPAGPGFVNLGMWLATTPPEVDPVVARAEAGSNWAEVTARLGTTTFTFGNGDEVVCDGFGAPIPEAAAESVEEGPCGYTYREASGDTPFTITVTSTWTVTYVLSDGRTGSRDDIVLPTTVEYEVVEIQTVGTQG